MGVSVSERPKAPGEPLEARREPVERFVADAVEVSLRSIDPWLEVGHRVLGVHPHQMQPHAKLVSQGLQLVQPAAQFLPEWGLVGVHADAISEPCANIDQSAAGASAATQASATPASFSTHTGVAPVQRRYDSGKSRITKSSNPAS